MKLGLTLCAAFALLATVGVSSCQRDRADLTTQTSSAQRTPKISVDGCSRAGPLLPAVVCQNSDLNDQNRALANVMRSQLAVLSHDGQQMLLDNQIKWFEAERVECAVAMTDKALSSESKVCLSAGLLGRQLALANLTEWDGPYLMQRVDEVRVYPRAQHTSATGPTDPNESDTFMNYVSYPRIDGVAAGAAAFNIAAMRTPRFTEPQQTEEIAIYRIAYAGSDIVSVEYVSYGLPIGGGENTRLVGALSFLMKEARPLEARDVFKIETQWLDFVTGQAGVRLAAAHNVCSAPPSRADMREAIGRAQNWIVSADGLVILLPEYSIEPVTLEGCAVMISWRDLAPYIKRRAATPIGVQKTVRTLADG